jgi:hypothetical protein
VRRLGVLGLAVLLAASLACNGGTTKNPLQRPTPAVPTGTTHKNEPNLADVKITKCDVRSPDLIQVDLQFSNTSTVPHIMVATVLGRNSSGRVTTVDISTTVAIEPGGWIDILGGEVPVPKGGAAGTECSVVSVKYK